MRKNVDIDFNHSIWKTKKALIDSRQVNQAKESIFFAFKGQRRDGHQFIPELYRKGVRTFVISQAGFHPVLYPNACFIRTDSVLAVLQEWAKWHRTQYPNLPVIAITGSNGKTIIKEWLSVLLADRFRIVKSPKSFNSQIGVPLSVLGIESKHSLGIFEAGISQKEEMQALEDIIQAQIGIFSNIGEAHAEGFDSQTEKIQEKLNLFKNSQYLVYPADDLPIHQQVALRYSDKKIYAWGTSNLATIPIQLEEINTGQTVVQIQWKRETYSIVLPFSAKAPVQNSIHCLIILLHFGYGLEQIQEKVQELKAVKMRLELKEAINESLLVDDSYNNDLAGLEIALDFMRRQHSARAKTPKSVILSDLYQMKETPKLLCQKIANLLAQHQIDKFIGIGKNLQRYRAIFETIGLQRSSFFPNTQEFLSQFSPYDYLQADTILIKGARTFQFEKIAQVLKKRVHPTVLEINLNALAHNFRFYRQQLDSDTKMMVMVKAFAYGSGNYEVASLLEYLGADYLGVAYVDEGIVLRQRGASIPIMVMNSQATDFNLLHKYRLEPVIYSFELLDELREFVQHKSVAPPFPVHIELDTGMHRLGFDWQQGKDWIDKLKKYTVYVDIVGVFSHLVASESEEHALYSLGQIQHFEQFANRIYTHLEIQPLRHMLNTGGIARFSKFQFDMVRLGIGLHGIDPSGKFQGQLKSVATLKTVVLQIHTLDTGQTIGYGRMGKVSQKTRIAVLAIGYADGFLRAFGKGVGQVYISGALKAIIGNICMDMCFVDIGDLELKVGDEAIIFGPELPIEKQAKAIGTIPYELLTNVSMRVPRVFYEE